MSGQWKRSKGEVGPILARSLWAISLPNGGMRLQFGGIAWRVDGIGLMSHEILPAFRVLQLAF
jgi:hypothetical protein